MKGVESGFGMIRCIFRNKFFVLDENQYRRHRKC